MQLLVRIDLDKPLTLTKGYRDMLRGTLYQLLEKQNVDFSGFIHNSGFRYGKRKYKLFSFSDVSGSFETKRGKCIFADEASFVIRSVEPFFGYAIKNELLQNGIRLGNHVYKNVEVKSSNPTIEKKEVAITMISPICVYKTEDESNSASDHKRKKRRKKKKLCFGPDSEEFYSLIKSNFRRKYEACFGEAPLSDIEIEYMVDGDSCEPEYTEIKDGSDTLIAWYGDYLLRGERKYLDFLYQTGLGSKNSKGLGLFDVRQDI